MPFTDERIEAAKNNIARNLARANDRISEYQDGFPFKARQKEATECVSRAYDDFRLYVLYGKYSLDLPYSLTHVRDKHVEKVESECGKGEELKEMVELLKKAKSIPVVRREKAKDVALQKRIEASDIKNIAAQFDAMVPAIAKHHERWLLAVLEHYAAVPFKEHYEKFRNDGTYQEISRYFVKVDPRDYTVGAERKIDRDAVKRDSAKYGQAQVDAFKRKLELKLVDLTNIHELQICGLEFSFRGNLGNRKVFVEQSTVFKVSKFDRPFNQWPCRIYVDGKFVPEEKFKELAKRG